ncbi:unnamed protein product [Symbiodinium pilosum]|uniref:Uncharacterized protein n=1 Tax=Symbiodinium pilosum TaxID=2952 RepID=A0A812Y510_SYMPI|nr:unnamed protein product [Symbiodinium pilosum]
MRQVGIAAAVHGFLLIGFSYCIQAASSNRHLEEALPWLVRFTVMFMFSLSCCTLVYLGQGKPVLAMVGISFCVECILLHCLASFSKANSGRVPLAYYEVLVGCTATAVLSQCGIASQSSQDQKDKTHSIIRFS